MDAKAMCGAQLPPGSRTHAVPEPADIGDTRPADPGNDGAVAVGNWGSASHPSSTAGAAAPWGYTSTRGAMLNTRCICALGKHLPQVLNSALNSAGRADSAGADCVDAVPKEADWAPVRQDWHH